MLVMAYSIRRVFSLCIWGRTRGSIHLRQGQGRGPRRREVVDGPSGGGGREQVKETDGSIQKAPSKGKRLGGEKGRLAEEERLLPGSIRNDSNNTNISNINQTYYVSST